MKRIALTVALLLGGTAVAHANPPGMSPGPAPQAQPQAGPGGWMGPRGPMAGPGRMQRDGARAGKRHLPPRLRARLVAMFDRDGDGRLQGPERRAAKKFVRQLRHRRQGAGQGFGPRQGGPRRGGPGGGQGDPGGFAPQGGPGGFAPQGGPGDQGF